MPLNSFLTVDAKAEILERVLISVEGPYEANRIGDLKIEGGELWRVVFPLEPLSRANIGTERGFSDALEILDGLRLNFDQAEFEATFVIEQFVSVGGAIDVTSILSPEVLENLSSRGCGLKVHASLVWLESSNEDDKGL